MYLTLVPILKRYTFHTADGTEYARVPHATGALEPWTHRGSFTSLFNIGAAQVRIHLFCACAARCKVERLRGAMLEALTLTPESYACSSFTQHLRRAQSLTDTDIIFHYLPLVRRREEPLYSASSL